MAYAVYTDVETRIGRTFDDSEIEVCNALLDDASEIIDAYASANATDDQKKLVSIRMVVRSMGALDVGVPIGATQGSMSALGYSQSWTVSSGTVGELYLNKLDKKMLGASNSIGSHSPLEDV